MNYLLAILSYIGNNTRGSSYFFGKKSCLGCCCVVLYCVALFVVSCVHHVITQCGVWRHWWFDYPSLHLHTEY